MGFGAVKLLVSNYKPVTASAPTTYDDYIDALDLDLRGLGNTTIIIKNTHASNSLMYKVLVRVEYDGIDYTEIPETTLAAGADPNREIIQRAYARARLQIKSATAGTPASWQADAIRMPEQ